MSHVIIILMNLALLRGKKKISYRNKKEFAYISET